jgi:hypothetical protein
VLENCATQASTSPFLTLQERPRNLILLARRELRLVHRAGHPRAVARDGLRLSQRPHWPRCRRTRRRRVKLAHPALLDARIKVHKPPTLRKAVENASRLLQQDRVGSERERASGGMLAKQRRSRVLRKPTMSWSRRRHLCHRQRRRCERGVVWAVHRKQQKSRSWTRRMMSWRPRNPHPRQNKGREQHRR